MYTTSRNVAAMHTTTTETTTRHLVTSGAGSDRIDAALPAPGPDEVRVRIAAAAVNPVDVHTRAGIFHSVGFIPAGAQAGLGWDLAGTVEAVGDDVRDLLPGDDVIAIRDDFAAPIGTHGEAIVLPARTVARAPHGIEPAAAATIALNALTARQALDLLALPAGATLLITGAAGAVGGFAVELAVHRGLRVVAQSAERDFEWLRSIGAHAVIGRDGRVPEPVDGALDAAQLGKSALAAVRDGGAFVGVTAPTTPSAEREIRVSTVHVHAEPGDLDELARMAEEDRLTLRVAEVLPLHEADRAYDAVAQGGLRGRIVLTTS